MIPSWLDPAKEITGPLWSPSREDFIFTCFDLLRKLGVPQGRAAEVVANSAVETGWGRGRESDPPELRGVLGHNLGGVKAHRPWSGPWWRKAGHQSSGDPPVCFYKAYPSLEAFFESWLGTYVPKPPNRGRYAKTGQAFHGNGDWFLELCLAGYKGSVTQANPTASHASFQGVVARVRRTVLQRALGVTPDGVWGPKSQKALKAWETKYGRAGTFENVVG
jgi:hypothetical protein